MNFTKGLGTDLPAFTAGVRANGDGNPNTAELLPQEHATAGQTKATVGFLQPKALTVTSSAFLNAFAFGSAYVFARGRRFFHELASLRFGRMSRFAAVGALGTVLNLAIMSVMLGLEAHYLLAAIVATELTILSNFLMQERLVFHDMRGGRPFWHRLAASFGFNNLETLLRIPVLMLLVEALLIPGVLAQAVTLAAAFVVRFAFTSRIIYRVRPAASAPGPVPATTNTPIEVETA